MGNMLFIILGNQLFPAGALPKPKTPVFMAEDRGLCTHFKYHKHKLILFLAAMRHYAEGLRKNGWAVEYRKLDDASAQMSYEQKLHDAVTKLGATRLIVFEIEDKFFERRLRDFAKERSLELQTLPSPMFLTPRADFAAYLRQAPRPFMRTFYEQQRRRLNLLMEKDQPRGGQFSFDVENRKPLPESIDPPTPGMPRKSEIVRDVSSLVDAMFVDHPGDSNNFWLPVTRSDAMRWLRNFLHHRFANFGAYEDAIPRRSEFVFHSVLSPTINLGLLTPAEVVKAAIAHADRHDVPLASLEGFVRQVIGWREFVRGIYQNFSEKQDRANFWGHKNPLGGMWYRGDSGIPPLDAAIAKVNRFGWCHHIERLMVISNLMQLCGIAPKEGHRWFMEMFVDSSDWVMGPNVYGMGLFSDGGIFATKPYLCGSNYLLKMSDHPRGPWCDIVDGLYWSFVDRHRDFFDRNPRTIFLTKNLDKLNPERRKEIFALAKAFRRKAVEP